MYGKTKKKLKYNKKILSRNQKINKNIKQQKINICNILYTFSISCHLKSKTHNPEVFVHKAHN